MGITHTHTHAHTHTHTHGRVHMCTCESNGAQLHTDMHTGRLGIQSPEEKRWVLRTDLNDAIEEECQRE